MSILNRMFKVMELKNIKSVELANYLKINKSVISGWKSRNISPPTDYLVPICTFLNVTLDYLLLGNSDNDSTLKFEKVNFNNLSDSFQKLSDKHKERVLERIEAYLEEDSLIREDNNVIYMCDAIKNRGNFVAEKAAEYKTVPVMGLTAAGQPIDYPDQYSFTDTVQIPEGIKADFALRVKGDSMEPDILNGAIVYVRKNEHIEDGDIVIVAIDDAVTCKKVFTYSDRQEFVSINPKYIPIVVTDDTDINIQIIGKVIHV